jgi:hypothetical protein
MTLLWYLFTILKLIVVFYGLDNLMNINRIVRHDKVYPGYWGLLAFNALIWFVVGVLHYISS